MKSILLLYSIFITMFLGCMKVDYKNPEGKVELSIQPIESIENSTFTNLLVNVSNRTDKPIIIISITAVNEARVSKYVQGTQSIETWKHKYNKNNMFFYEKNYDTKENPYVVPEVHLIKEVVYPQKTKVFKVPTIIQSLTDSKDMVVSLSYYVVDSSKDIMEFHSKSWIEQNKKERYVYYPAKSVPKKLEGNIISSQILGNSKDIEASIKIKINNPPKGVNFPWPVIEFVKDPITETYLFSDGGETLFVFKDGKQILAKKTNLVRDFVKGIMKGEVTVAIPDEYWDEISPMFDGYEFKRKLPGNRYKETKYPYSKLLNTFLKLHEKGYIIFKEMIVPIENN
ncbi:hypothetical protein JXR93_10890 [bacterium]|nr:hypothetical protein [bacterium]